MSNPVQYQEKSEKKPLSDSDSEGDEALGRVLHRIFVGAICIVLCDTEAKQRKPSFNVAKIAELRRHPTRWFIGEKC